jgi:acyl dehydratase
MTSRHFDTAAQMSFATLSGDYNPMHVDPHLARRLQTGGVVVHGVHAVLWALDTALRDGIVAGGIRAIGCRFGKFILVGSDVKLRLQRADEQGALLQLETDGLITTTINVKFGARETAPAATAAGVPLPAEPEERDVPEMAGLSRSFIPHSPLGQYMVAFPALAEAIGAERIAGLTLLSSIVGMAVPGLHSIFDSLDIALVDQPGSAVLGFRVDAADQRFRQVRMKIDGCGLRGGITTFVRRPMPEQPSVVALAEHVKPGEFSGSRALIVGGSRGLGALTAKLIAAGGGEVIVTYAQGQDDAAAVASEIDAFAKRKACETLRFDVLADTAGELAGRVGSVSQIYYFATTKIFRQKPGLYVPAVFEEFAQVYVHAFRACCQAFLGTGALSVFYPSSTALDKRSNDMTEYSMAKAAGEVLCADLDRYVPNLHVIWRRLPRMLTDQTATVALAKSEDSLTVMLPIIRDVQAARPVVPDKAAPER